MSSADSSNRYRMIEAVYQRAVDLPRERRTAFLRSECGGDPALLEQVESLLQHWDAAPREYLESPVHGLLAPAGLPGILPDRIGQYSIIRMLGRGGMGSVYEAQQLHPHRRVALKVIRSDAFSADTLHRFRNEADVLGQLRHPGIAQIYEFGAGDAWIAGKRGASQQYFAMELIDGAPLTEYARSANLGLRDSLELLARICDALQHAHQKGVIHRDLKPSNILVEKDGHPKVLDFGVARVQQSDGSDAPTRTSAGQLIGTVAYMSPEQLEGRAHFADTRSDVYSLGVVAFELLTGRLPFDLAGLTMPQVIRVLAERDPAPAGAVQPELRGDVQAILARALERDPERRYGSAADMAADLRRYLRHEPVAARPTNALYYFRKFVRRNRGLVTAASAVFVVLAGAAVWIAAAMIQAQRANVRATAMNEFLRDILAEADPATGRADVQLVEVLRAAGDQAASRFAGAPDLEAEVRVLLARAFSNLSLSDEAVAHAEQALELRTRLLGERHPLTLQVTSHLADLYKRVNRYDDALRMAEQVIALAPPELQNEKDVLDARRSRAGILARRDRQPEAEQELRSVLETARAHLGEDHVVTLASANDVAWFLQQRVRRKLSQNPESDLRESAQILTALLAPSARVHGENSYATLNKMSNLAQTLRLSQRFDEAAAYAEKVMQLGSTRLGEAHAIICRARGVLADARYRRGRFAEAADLTIQNIELGRRLAQGRDTVGTLSDMSDTLHLIDAGGRLAEGEQYVRVLCERLGGAGAHDVAQPLRYRTYLARFISRQGRLDEADALFAEILSAAGADARQRTFANLAYGAHLAQRGEFAEAERRLLAAQAALTESDWVFVAALQELVRLYEALGRKDEAEKWLARLENPAPEAEAGATAGEGP